MLTIDSFKVFDLILRDDRRRPGPVDAGAVAVHLPKGFEENQFGYASAVSLVLFVICFGVTVVQFLVNKRRNS